MTQYLSYADFNRLYPFQDGFDVDSRSRFIATCILQKFWYGCLIEETTGCNSTDLLVKNPDGTVYAVEVKDRSFGNISSTTYNDAMIEMRKFNNLCLRKAKGEFERIHLFSFFADGVCAVSVDLDKNIQDTRTYHCNEQTALDSEHRQKVDKQCAIFKQDKKVYFCIAIDGLKWYPVTSYNPVDVAYLNHCEQCQSVKLF